MGERSLPSPDALLEALGPLPADASLEAVQEWLEALRDHVRGAPPEYRHLIRGGVKKVLGGVEEVSAPASLADQYLQPKKGRETSEEDLQGRGIKLAAPEPWPDPVDGAAVLEELVGVFERFLALPDGASVSVGLWVLHAHAHDAAVISPNLAVTSPTKRCGKTTLLELASAVVPKPLPAANITSAGVFRAVDAFTPTLLVDEADTFLDGGSGELRGILNSGHRRSLAVVVRNVAANNDYVPRLFNTWAPKAIALIGELPDTLADRSIEIRMRRRTEDEEVERLRLDRLHVLEPLRRRAWTWAQDHRDELEEADPDVPGGLHDRQRDNWRPLLAIADLVGESWPERAREAARLLSGQRDEEEQIEGVRLLADVHRVFRREGAEKLPTRQLLGELNGLEESPWRDKRGGRGLSANQLAALLRPFEISSTALWVGHGDTGRMLRGYKREDFQDAWGRYLSSETPLREVQDPQESLWRATETVADSRKDADALAPPEDGRPGLFTATLAPPAGEDREEGGSESGERPTPGQDEVFSARLA